MDTILNFKTSKKLKMEAQKVARHLGLPLGTIMNHYLQDFVQDKKVLFTLHPTPSATVVKELQALSLDAQSKKNVSPAFSTSKDAEKWLNA